MIDAYNSTLPYRIGFAIVFFLVLGAWDWIKHPQNPTRVYEYSFLVASMLLSIVYGIVHDHITATISADYFLKAKGLDQVSQPFRWAVTCLAIKATYGPGLLTGALILIANNPSKNRAKSDASPLKPQLPYPHMLRLCVYPVVAAAICATLGGILVPAIVFSIEACRWFADAALAYTTPDRVTPFLVVWGVHAGSYLGATLGTVIAVVKVARARKALMGSVPLGQQGPSRATNPDESSVVASELNDNDRGQVETQHSHDLRKYRTNSSQARHQRT